MKTYTNIELSTSLAGNTLLIENSRGEQEFIQLNDKQSEQYSSVMAGKFERKRCHVCDLVKECVK